MGTTYEGLVTCSHRKVDDGGRILCGLIKGSDREVSIELCRACPVPQINCQHLRAAMQKTISTPITVRFATGRVEVWDNEAPTIGFKQAACAVKAMPIHSPRDCTGCPLRMAQVLPQTATQVARRAKATDPVRLEPAQAPSSTIYEVTLDRAESQSARASRQAAGRVPKAAHTFVERAQKLADNNLGLSREKSAAGSTIPERDDIPEAPPKIILFQKWLVEQFNKKKAASIDVSARTEQDEVQEITYSPAAVAHEDQNGYERCVGWTD